MSEKHKILMFLLCNKLLSILKEDIIPNNLLQTKGFTLLFSFI